MPFDEPSEMVFAGDDLYYVLANKAYIYKTNHDGNLLSKNSFAAYDIEGACLVNNKLYISDESMRLVYKVDTSNFKIEKTFQLSYGGARNLAFESITYLPAKQEFLLATEKSPCVFYEYSDSFQLLNQFTIKGIREVSSMTYHNSKLYILSDEEEAVYEVDPFTFEIMRSWTFPVLNPEGICFDKDNNMMIVSDDMNKLFLFNNLKH